MNLDLAQEGGSNTLRKGDAVLRELGDHLPSPLPAANVREELGVHAEVTQCGSHALGRFLHLVVVHPPHTGEGKGGRGEEELANVGLHLERACSAAAQHGQHVDADGENVRSARQVDQGEVWTQCPRTDDTHVQAIEIGETLCLSRSQRK